MKIKVGDTVVVIAGNHKGSQGEVLRVDRKRNRVVVDGVNMVKKHQKPQNVGGRQTQGGIIEFEAPMAASNVMLVDPKSGEATRIGLRRDDDGKRIRFAKKSGTDLD